ncbi:MAG TPA: hypothetical protein VGH28_30380 [Polyangiaceae bacterium]|jgi:hypothetical protein
MRGSPLVTVVIWAFYFGMTASIILLDRQIQRNKAYKEGSVDFLDRSPAGYLMLAFICGPLPLVIYFGATRKSFVGWLMGIGAAIAVYAVLFFVAYALSVGMRVGAI